MIHHHCDPNQAATAKCSCPLCRQEAEETRRAIVQKQVEAQAENNTSTQPTTQVRNHTKNNTVTLESSETPVKIDTLFADTQQIAKETKAKELKLERKH